MSICGEKILFFFLLFFGVKALYAQQNGLSNQYLLNGYYFNPAFAGKSNEINGLLGYRKQWVGFKGAPTTKYFSINSSVKENMGIGAAANIEEFNIIEKFSARISYAYKAKLSDNHLIAFGLDGTYQENRLKAADIDVDFGNDPLLLSSTFYRGSTFDANFGIRYQFKKFELGMAGINIFQQKSVLKSENNNNQSQYLNIRHYNISASYELNVLENALQLTPFVFGRYAEKTPFSIDGGVKAAWKNAVWLAMAYRTNHTLIGSLGVNIADYVQIGYSYDAGFGTDISTFYKNTHEVYVGFKIGYKSETKSAADFKQTLALEMRADSLANELNKKDLEVKQMNENLANKELEYKNKLKSIEDERKDDVLINSESKDQVNDTTKEIGADFVTMDQLHKGHYIVVKSFLNKEFALNAMTEIKTKGYQPLLVYNKSRGYYYVYIEKLDNLQSALKELENIKNAGFKDAWLYLHQ